MQVTLSKTQQRTDRQDKTNGDKKNENIKVVQIEASIFSKTLTTSQEQSAN